MSDLNLGGLTDAQLRLYTVLCVSRVRHLMTDPRSIAALDVAERHARGEATDEELAAARTAAWDAVWDAEAAEAAAAAAAGAAAGAAAWATADAAAAAAAALAAERSAQLEILEQIRKEVQP
jgi:hypothetical protein